ncbi:MAG: molybdopterin-dependent oxidoreductase [Dehalococcoidia bacterium]|nr:molybdopterin-dependent oxidoreductase [Dehalococcoidia bacterium]
MKEISLTIDGKKVRGHEGDTVLDVCRKNGIDVPTLCEFKGLTNVGACRMCVVDIEGERRINPSCTYPARDGLVVHTKTEKVEKYRRLILELMFTEKNHYCMYCERSGDCELQATGYRYQLDNVRYPYTTPATKVDALSEYIAIDHGRCILCGRCVRVCSEIEANHTLDFAKRGFKTVISADLAQPLGTSSCTHCGACVQACPTGAIFSKLSLYRAKPKECQEVKTVCPVCGVGCELTVLVKDNNLVSIKSPDLTGEKGPLCRMGRFGLLADGHKRITSPLIRDKEGKLKECTLDEALEAAGSRMKKLGKNFTGVVSSRLPSETISLFCQFMRQVVGSKSVDTMGGEAFRVIAEGTKAFNKKSEGPEIECTLDEILRADCILLVGADPVKTHPIAASFIRRAVDRNRARLIVIDEQNDVLAIWRHQWLKPRPGSVATLLNGLMNAILSQGPVRGREAPAKLVQSLSQYNSKKVQTETDVGPSDLEMAAETLGKAQHAVIVYGQGVWHAKNSAVVTDLLNLADLTGNREGERLRVISLKPAANSRGAWSLGAAAKDLSLAHVQGLYLLVSDEQVDNDEVLGWLRTIDFLVVQASYRSAVTSMADVVLPSPTWAERDGGEYVSLDGHVTRSNRVIEPKKGLLQDQEMLKALAKKMGHELSSDQEVSCGQT